MTKSLLLLGGIVLLTALAGSVVTVHRYVADQPAQQVVFHGQRLVAGRSILYVSPAIDGVRWRSVQTLPTRPTLPPVLEHRHEIVSDTISGEQRRVGEYLFMVRGFAQVRAIGTLSILGWFAYRYRVLILSLLRPTEHRGFPVG